MKGWPGDDLVVEAATSREAMDRLVPHIYALVRRAKRRSVYGKQAWFRSWGEDAIQEAVIRCVRVVPRFDPEIAPALHFFGRCIRTCWSDERKRIARRASLTSAFSIDSEDAERISRDLRVEQIGQRATRTKHNYKGMMPETLVREIRERLEQGERIAHIERALLISRARIYKIKKGLSYRDVI